MHNKIEPMDAESLAITALLWVANDPVMMRRFLDLTGIDADQIRLAAKEPAFLAGVLKFISMHEPSLLAFSESNDTHPSLVIKALRHLPGGADDYLISS